jgi:hypothetical protein
MLLRLRRSDGIAEQSRQFGQGSHIGDERNNLPAAFSRLASLAGRLVAEDESLAVIVRRIASQR